MEPSDRKVSVAHIYEHDAHKFEQSVNEVLERLVSEGAFIAEIQYASVAPAGENKRGGFGALVIYESRA